MKTKVKNTFIDVDIPDGSPVEARPRAGTWADGVCRIFDCGTGVLSEPYESDDSGEESDKPPDMAAIPSDGLSESSGSPTIRSLSNPGQKKNGISYLTVPMPRTPMKVQVRNTFIDVDGTSASPISMRQRAQSWATGPLPKPGSSTLLSPIAHTSSLATLAEGSTDDGIVISPRPRLQTASPWASRPRLQTESPWSSQPSLRTLSAGSGVTPATCAFGMPVYVAAMPMQPPGFVAGSAPMMVTQPYRPMATLSATHMPVVPAPQPQLATSVVQAATSADNAREIAEIVQELPSIGSAGHLRGTCKPCAFGLDKCRNAYNCEFCHLCPPPEKTKRGRWILKRKKDAAELQHDVLDLATMKATGSGASQ